MGQKLSALTFAPDIGVTDLFYMAEDLGGGIFFERKVELSQLDARYVLASAVITPPFTDTSALIKGSADVTKLLRFEVDGFTAGTTRVLTPQNADYIIAGTNIINDFTVNQTFSARIFLSDGDVVNPSYSFFNDVSLGMYLESPGRIGLAGSAYITGALEVVGEARASIFFSGDGSAANPSHSFLSDPSTGIYLTGTGDLGFTTAGVQRMQISPTGDISINGAAIILLANGAANFANSSASIDALGSYVGPLMDIETKLTVEAPNGAAQALVRFHLYNPDIAADTFAILGSGEMLLVDNIRQTFNPGATVAGFNFGSVAADPSTPINGDAWYQSTANELRFRINGATVAFSAGASPPFTDTNALIKGSVDATKLLRFEVDGFTTATTRVLTPQNADYTIAGLEIANVFTLAQTALNFIATFEDDGFEVVGAGRLRGAGGNLVLAPVSVFELWDGGAVPIMIVGTSQLSFFNVPVVSQQASGGDLTNNVTAGGVDDSIDNWTSLTTYATDAAAIRDAVYQLARKLKQINDGLRAYGLFT